MHVKIYQTFMRKTLVILVLSIFVLSSCNKQTFQKIVKSDDYELKYHKAKQLFLEEKYSKALELYEQLVPHEKGRERGEEVAFYYAYCYYGMQDYILAGYYFREFTEKYEKSQYAEEALFLSAYCYYLDAPVWSLDQQTTKYSMEEFKLFVSRYPNSTKIDSCNMLIDELRGNLSTKSYKNSMLYYDIGYYRAAYISLENSLKDFPDSKYEENIRYYAFKANYEFAEKSIKSKQIERYNEALERYQAYEYFHEDGKYTKDVSKMFKNINSELETLEKPNNNNNKTDEKPNNKNNKTDEKVNIKGDS